MTSAIPRHLKPRVRLDALQRWARSDRTPSLFSDLESAELTGFGVGLRSPAPETGVADSTTVPAVEAREAAAAAGTRGDRHSWRSSGSDSGPAAQPGAKPATMIEAKPPRSVGGELRSPGCRTMSRLTREQVIERILVLNPSARKAYLDRFDANGLSVYLARLYAVSETLELVAA